MKKKFEPPYKFLATLLEDDPRTGYKKNTQLNPKGFYWHKNNVILVGDIYANHTIRLSFPANIIKMEIK